METHEKPRVSLAEYEALMTNPKLRALGLEHLPAIKQHAAGTVAWLLGRILEERSQPGARPIGTSQGYIMHAIQRRPIGVIQLSELKPVDFLNHCRARIAAGAKPQTVNQDCTYLSGALKYGFEILETPGAEDAHKAYKKAKPQLVREQLIGKSQPRDRLPSDEELDALRAEFARAFKGRKKEIDMLPVVEAELTTGRRISELCRIERKDVNVAERTCWLYNLKNSKGKGFHAEFALIEGAWELFEQRLKVIPDEPTARLYPFNSKSVGAKYTRAKNRLGIKGLRMHDNRAETFVRLLEKGYSKEQVQKGVSLHKGDGKVLVDVYLRIKAKDLHRGPAAQPMALAA